MTARHMLRAVIQSRRQALHPHRNFGESLASPVAVAFTEAELFALADHYRRTGLAGRVSVLHPDLGAAVGAILAAADDIESKEGDR